MTATATADQSPIHATFTPIRLSLPPEGFSFALDDWSGSLMAGEFIKPSPQTQGYLASSGLPL